MKKLLTMLTMALVAIFTVSARDEIYHNGDVLPQPAQQTLKKNFPKAKVNRVKVDKEIFGGRDYEVILSNGAEIEFNKDGDWREVDCGRSAVPQGFIINPISQYVKKNHKGAFIIKIDKDRNDYEIELNDGTDIKFDRAGQFLRYDD